MADNSAGRSPSLDSEGDFIDPLGAKDPLSIALDDDIEEFNIDLSPNRPKLELENSIGHHSAHFASLSTEDDPEDESKDLFVVVDNPEKHATAMESYITFRVTTKTTRSEFDGQDFQVRRRYNDFLWLRQRLEETQPTLIVPPLPEKQSFKRLDRFSQDFVRTRKVALQIFLARVADHPVLSFNKYFMIFLTAKQAELAAAKKEGSGFISRMANSIHNMSAAYMMKNRPDDFTAMQEYVNQFGEKLGVLDRISQRVIREETDHCGELNEWGPIFTLWSNSEDRLSPVLAAVAKSVEKCYLALQELVDSTEANLNQPLKEYMLYNEAVKTVLRRRDAIQTEYQMTLDELNRKKDERDQLSQQVETLNDKMTCCNADLKADMERWHKTKRKDFRKLFMNMADRQIQYYQQCLSAWEEVIPKIKSADALKEIHKDDQPNVQSDSSDQNTETK